MERFVKSIRESLRARNWFGALFIALAMPDICGGLEQDPSKRRRKYANSARYKDWFDRYLNRAFDGLAFTFTSEECWQFRNSCLHSGGPQTGGITRVLFVEPSGIQMHRNEIDYTGQSKVIYQQMQVDTFCEAVCEAVELWGNDVAGDQTIQSRIVELIRIHDLNKLGYSEVTGQPEPAGPIFAQKAPWQP
jgi:hypothetical protein